MHLKIVLPLLVVSVAVFTVTASPVKAEKDEIQILEDLRELLERRRGPGGGKGGEKGNSHEEGGGKGGKKGGQKNSHGSDSNDSDEDGRGEPIDEVLMQLHHQYEEAKQFIHELTQSGCNISTEFLDDFEAMLSGGPEPPMVSIDELNLAMTEVKEFLVDVSSRLSQHTDDTTVQQVGDTLAGMEDTNYCAIVRMMPLLFKMELLGVDGASSCSKMFETFLEFESNPNGDGCAFETNFAAAARSDSQCFRDDVEDLKNTADDASSGGLTHIQQISRFQSVVSTAFRMSMDSHIMRGTIQQYIMNKDKVGGSFCAPQPSTTPIAVVEEKKEMKLDDANVDKLQQLISLLKTIRRK